jgi:hypothetical protein
MGEEGWVRGGAREAYEDDEVVCETPEYNAVDEGAEESTCGCAVVEDAERDHGFRCGLPFVEDECCVEREAEEEWDEDGC